MEGDDAGVGAEVEGDAGDGVFGCGKGGGGGGIAAAVGGFGFGGFGGRHWFFSFFVVVGVVMMGVVRFGYEGKRVSLSIEIIWKEKTFHM